MVMKLFLVALLTVVLSRAQSTSELLQKGIYLQETMGDLDGAIKIYKQIAQASQESRANAAQAQFRLGVCLEKKGQPAEAARILQKVVADYPEQTDLVARAKSLLPSGMKPSSAPPSLMALLPAPWIDGEILDLSATVGNASLPSGAVRMRFAVRSSKTHPGNWVFENRLYNVASMFTIQIETDRDTLRPVSAVSHGYHPVMGDSQTTYQNGEARTEVKGKDPKTLKLDAPVYDSNEIVAVLRRLPLAMGYKTSLPVFTAAGMDTSQMRVAVTAEEDIKTPAGDFHAFKVELNQSQTYWISTDPSRYLVKLEQGSMMTALLSAISRSDQSSVYRNEKLGISLNLPPGWTAEDAASFEPAKQAVQLLDSDSQAIVTLTIEPRKLTTPPTLAGMRSEAEKNNKSPQFPDQKLRPDTWQQRQVGGHPALSWVADTSDMLSKTPMVLYTTWVRSDSLKAVFSAKVDPADLDSLQQRLDEIVNTFTLR
jgi:tetratricopeptide (TPR) repeat protein